MTFLEFCDHHDIHGLWQVALHRALVQKYGMSGADSAGEKAWGETWDAVLNEMTIKHPAIKGNVLR